MLDFEDVHGRPSAWGIPAYDTGRAPFPSHDHQMTNASHNGSEEGDRKCGPRDNTRFISDVFGGEGSSLGRDETLGE